MRRLTILESIAGLTAALIAQDSATDDTAEARRRLIRLALAQGHTASEIAEASGITRQRVAQLAREDAKK